MSLEMSRMSFELPRVLSVLRSNEFFEVPSMFFDTHRVAPLCIHNRDSNLSLLYQQLHIECIAVRRQRELLQFCHTRTGALSGMFGRRDNVRPGLDH